MTRGSDRRVVILFITSLGVGGAETQLARLAAGLRAKGEQVHVVALRSVPGIGDELAEDGFPVHTLVPPGRRPGPLAVARAFRLVRRLRPDAIVTFLLQANVVGRLVGRASGVPVLASIRNERFGGRGRVGQWIGDVLERGTARWSFATVVNSARVGDALVRRGVVSAAQLRVVPNAVLEPPGDPDPDARRSRRRALGIGPEEFLWLAAGRLEPQKDYPTLVDAFERVAQRHGDARLRIAGDGDLRATVAARIEAAGLADHVGLLGLRRDVPELIGVADGVVLASRWEGAPNVVLEAMAAGRPTVATRVGAVPDLIEDGRTGWSAPPADPAALSTAMIEAMEATQEERSAVGEAARSRIRGRYGAEAVVDTWRRLIDETVAAPPLRERRPA